MSVAIRGKIYKHVENIEIVNLKCGRYRSFLIYFTFDCFAIRKIIYIRHMHAFENWFEFGFGNGHVFSTEI